MAATPDFLEGTFTAIICIGATISARKERHGRHRGRFFCWLGYYFLCFRSRFILLPVLNVVTGDVGTRDDHPRERHRSHACLDENNFNHHRCRCCHVAGVIARARASRHTDYKRAVGAFFTRHHDKRRRITDIARHRGPVPSFVDSLCYVVYLAGIVFLPTGLKHRYCHPALSAPAARGFLVTYIIIT